jgi:hypothetical protein
MPGDAMTGVAMTGAARVAAALAVQLLAQQFLGPWGAAAGGVAISVFSAQGRAGRLAAYSAAMAAAALLLVAIAQGATIPQFADKLGANFGVPGAALLALTLLLPAMQAGLLAAGTSRLLRGARMAS